MDNRPKTLIGGLETGGITFVTSIADITEPTKILYKETFQTMTPEETLPKVAAWFNQYTLNALGIASFGPIDINQSSSTYGYITTTPKKNWGNVDLVGQLRKLLKNGTNLPIGFQTDVNAAALAENMTAKHRDKTSCVYITVGGGIGVGVAYNQKPFIGLSHGEGGHIRLKKFIGNGVVDDFEGVCKFHGDCVEGLCSAPALSKRLGIDERDLANVSDDDAIWDLFAFYMGELCATITLMICPEVIVIGGGVLKRQNLFDKIRKACVKSLNGYIMLQKVVESTEEYIVPAVYSGNNTGVIGSLQMAANALRE